MTSFLDTVASDLFKRYGEAISQRCLIFPNRRAHLFFSESLSHIIQKPIWQPASKSIDELVKETSQLQVADPFTLLVELYEVYGNERKTKEPFDRFYYWGEALLHDFDQIDKYLVNASALFTNLRERKAFEGDFSFLSPEQVAHIQKFWSHFSHEKESRLQKEFTDIWDALLPIYQKLKERLAAKNSAYEGMVYRDVAQKIIDGHTEGLFPGQYVFIGFNALNSCEKTLFHFLKAQGQADFYWDYDAYYINNPQQEAGWFLRDNIKQFPPPEYEPDFSPFTTPKQIDIIAAPSNMAQTKIVPQLLRNLPADKRTAVILADEQLLSPLLHTLPAVTQHINVTMGYAFRQTAMYSLIEILFSLFAHGKPAGKHTKYYFKDVLSLLAHPYIKQLVNNEITEISNKIVLINNIFVTNLLFEDNQLLYTLLAPVADFRDLTNRLLFLMDELSTHKTLNTREPFLRGYVQHVARQINKLHDALNGSGLDISIPLYARLLRSILEQLSVPFTGEPLVGLQVMGLLETRNIDFENLIVLSVNEGTLPSKGVHISFIPYNLRKGFGLPLPEQQEAVWAYYFYRLLQRAQNIRLLYSTKNDGLHTGEASRYLLQLKLESGHAIHEKTAAFGIELPAGEKITIPKSAETTAALAKYCQKENGKTLSPSALNAYLACPLKFYFKYMAHIQEPDEIAEKVDNKLFGNLLHKSMEIIYRPWMGKKVTAEMIDRHYLHEKNALLTIIRQAITEEYYKTAVLPPDFYENGDLIITQDILYQYIKQLLTVDRQQAPFVPEGVEMPFAHSVPLTIDGQETLLRFGGIIDRLHRKDNGLYVVDYKTGHPDKAFETIADLLGNDTKRQHPAVLQTMLYALMLHLEKQMPVTPLLYFLRNSYAEAVDFKIVDLSLKQPVSNIADYAEALYVAFKHKLTELFDTSLPFSQTADTKTCKYCPYTHICDR
jgi:CRISPR/Cas system-associated exonuclease Cas4 (RecB family)